MQFTPHDILDRIKDNKWNIVVSVTIAVAILIMVWGIHHAATQVATVIPTTPSSTSASVSPVVTELSKTLSTTQHQPQSHDVEQPSHEGMTNTEQRLSAIMEKLGIGGHKYWDGKSSDTSCSSRTITRDEQLHEITNSSERIDTWNQPTSKKLRQGVNTRAAGSIFSFLSL